MSRDRGSLCLLLHSHMPYVEGFGTWPFGEEWLWEAVACVYLPLLELLEQTDAPLTIGLTPVLCDQLETLNGPAAEATAVRGDAGLDLQTEARIGGEQRQDGMSRR